MGGETHRALTADTITRTGLMRSPTRPNMNGDTTNHLRPLNTLLANPGQGEQAGTRAP